MRLTLVIATLGRGGAERLASILASSWSEQGNDVSILTLDHGDIPPSYPLHPSVSLNHLNIAAVSGNVLQALLRNVSRIRTLRRAIRDSRPDVVISFMDKTNVLVLLATRGSSIPVIILEQTDPALYDIGRIWKLLRRVFYPLANMLVCPIAGSLARFQAMAHVRGCVIPNPIDVPCFSGKCAKGDRHVLAAMGRLVHQKGFDLLLQAFSMIASHHPDWHLVIYGAGPLLHELEVQRRILGLDDKVQFAGAVSDPFAKLQSADLFVLSSRFEGFGMALAEAMACGLAAVSFDCPEGPSEIIRDGIDGLLVPTGDVHALAAALDHLMTDDKERQRLSSRAPEVRERFSVGRIEPSWDRLFAQLVH